MLFAEADPLGGWMQVILQSGALGLLAYIVVYLYPQSQRDARAEREAREQTFSAVVSALQLKFEERNREICTAVERQTVTITNGIKQQTTELSSALSSFCKARPA